MKKRQDHNEEPNWGFGMAHVKREGGPAHPDDFDSFGTTDEEAINKWYIRQMEAYMADTGDSEAYKHCIRNYLWANV